MSLHLGNFNWLFVSQMGAVLPAYYFYVFGATFVGGLLVPCAVVFFYQNYGQIVSVSSDIQTRQALNLFNSLSLWTALAGVTSIFYRLTSGAFFLALQSVFPMRDDTLLLHCIFAS